MRLLSNRTLGVEVVYLIENGSMVVGELPEHHHALYFMIATPDL